VRRSLEGYAFYIGRRESGPPRLGMLVTRRHAALASVRNRIKRCIREAFRLQQEELGSMDLLVRPPYGVRPSQEMIGRLRRLMGRLAQ
jgi:ribonuclease P protein component